jgi:hypothetical protein
MPGKWKKQLILNIRPNSLSPSFLFSGFTDAEYNSSSLETLHYEHNNSSSSRFSPRLDQSKSLDESLMNSGGSNDSNDNGKWSNNDKQKMKKARTSLDTPSRARMATRSASVSCCDLQLMAEPFADFTFFFFFVCLRRKSFKQKLLWEYYFSCNRIYSTSCIEQINCIGCVFISQFLCFPIICFSHYIYFLYFAWRKPHDIPLFLNKPPMKYFYFIFICFFFSLQRSGFHVFKFVENLNFVKIARIVSLIKTF